MEQQAPSAEEVPVFDGQRLVAWYRENKRDLPWRRDRDPYHVWVSEIMLQQTRVEAVKPYYERFLQALPDVKSLAEAPEDQLLKLWEGLGYYSRVRNMQKAARQIMDEYGGVFPSTRDELLKLSGIGPYTAGAIASIAFGRAVPAVDGNVLRVVSRLYNDDGDILSDAVKKRFASYVSRMIPKEDAGDFTQGMIELGATVCGPDRKPECQACPYVGACLACKAGRQTFLPVKKPPAKRRVEDYTVLILMDDEKYALHKRPARGLLAGMYEPVMLPGHLEQKEVLSFFSPGNLPIYIERLPDAVHIFSHIEWHMRAYLVRMDELRDRLPDADRLPEVRYFSKEEITGNYAVPSAFAKYKDYFMY